jgi:MFS family permease
LQLWEPAATVSVVRRARLANTLVFFTGAAVFATWASRIPAIQDRLGVEPGALALAFLALNAGAVAGLPAGGALVARAGSRAALRVGFAVVAPCLVAAAAAPTLAALCATLAATGAGLSIVDVAMNAQGAELERRARRPLLSGMHAGHSFGMLAGGLVGTAAVAAGFSVGAHFAVVAVVAAALGLAATVALVDEPRGDAPVLARPDRELARLGAVGFCAFLIEGAANDWSAVHLRAAQDASPALAAAGFSVFALGLALSRLGGDWLVLAVGRARALRWAGLVAAVGAVIATAPADPVVALAGWGLLGAGVAVVAPTILGAAGEDAPSPAIAIAGVSTVAYLGGFGGPPLIGALAAGAGLTAALGVLPLAALAVAGVALPREASRRSGTRSAR